MSRYTHLGHHIRHDHSWRYPQAVWGEDGDVTLVARYCAECAVVQVAANKPWRRVTRSKYPGIFEVCDKLRKESA